MMKFSWFFIFGLIILTVNSFGQKNESVESDTTIFADPLVIPSFPGGQVELTEYIKRNFNWTQGSLTVEGKVFVGFFVNVDGEISDAKVLRGLCESCDKEALRLVRSMPNWIAGTEYGKPTKTKMVLPIKFGL